MEEGPRSACSSTRTRRGRGSPAVTGRTKQPSESRRSRRKEMAHKKGAGSTRNGRDSAGQRLGVKEYAGARVEAGGVIVRPRGTKGLPRRNRGVGKEHHPFPPLPGDAGIKTAPNDPPRRDSLPA